MSTIPCDFQPSTIVGEATPKSARTRSRLEDCRAVQNADVGSSLQLTEPLGYLSLQGDSSYPGRGRSSAQRDPRDVAERSGRAQDKDDGGGLETLRRDGYM